MWVMYDIVRITSHHIISSHVLAIRYAYRAWCSVTDLILLIER